MLHKFTPESLHQFVRQTRLLFVSGSALTCRDWRLENPGPMERNGSSVPHSICEILKRVAAIAF